MTESTPSKAERTGAAPSGSLGTGTDGARTASESRMDVGAVIHMAQTFANAGAHEKATAFLQDQVKQHPEVAALHHNLGISLRILRRLPEALDCFQRAIALEPGSEACVSLAGSVLRELGRMEEALEFHGVAVRLNPESAHCIYNLANTLAAVGEYRAAVDAYKKSLVLQPDWVDALNNLISTLSVLGLYAESIPYLQQLWKLRPATPQDLVRLINALREVNEPYKALQFAEILVRDHPDDAEHYGLLASCLSLLGCSREAFDAYSKAMVLSRGTLRFHGPRIYTANYLPLDTPEELFAIHREYGRILEERYPSPALRRSLRAPGNRRIRIGYVSGDLCKHPVATFFQPILENHNPLRFEIFCYSNYALEDSTTQKLRKNVDHWRPVFNLSDADFCAQVSQDNIDILVDLSGHTARNRLEAFAQKPAPVQVTMVGYMQTSGLRAMDYRITDARFDPVGVSEHLHTETLIRMESGAVCFKPPECAPPPPIPPCLRGNPFTFGSFNNLAKVNAHVLDLWAEILTKIPDSRMHVVASDGLFFLEKMRARGVGADRLTILPRMPEREYLEAHASVDLILDTFPFNGLTVTMNALWMGVPSLNLRGATTASRAGFALMDRLGIGYFSVSSGSEFIKSAVRWASHPAELANLRGQLRSRVQQHWADGPAYTRELEARFEEMLSTRGAMIPSAPIALTDSEAPTPSKTSAVAAQFSPATMPPSREPSCLQEPNQTCEDQKEALEFWGDIVRIAQLPEPSDGVREFADKVRARADHVEWIHHLSGNARAASSEWKSDVVLGELWHHLKQPEWCKELLNTASRGPRNAQEWLYLGTAQGRCGMDEEMVESLKKSCGFANPPGRALLLLGEQVALRGDMYKAEQLYRKAISHSPALWEAYANLGVLLSTKGCFDEALRITESATKLSDDPRLIFNVAGYQQLCGMYWKSLLTTDKVIEKMPDSDEAYLNLSMSFWGLGMPDEAHAACEKAVRLKPDRASNHDNLLHTLNYLPKIDPALYFEKHRRYSEIFEKPRLLPPRHHNSRDPRRKLRIAYLSPDLRSHSVCHFIEPILRGHNRAEFEVFGIYTNSWRDSTTDRLEQMCDTWIEAAGVSDEDLAERIRSEQIDILIDLACHTSGNRLLVFPRRPAPIQMTMIGMQQTTGLISMNYRVTDADMDPRGMTEPLHTESLLRLKRGFVFKAPESPEPIVPLPAWSAGHITFGSFNNFAKTHPAVFDAWASILQQVPNSRLGAVVPDGAVFEDYFEAAGIARDRVFRMERTSGDAYLRMHNTCDMALDCFPFSGLTVSLFAAWMGVPTVTIAGQIPSARGGVSVMRGLDLQEWITAHTGEFVERSVALAGDWNQLAEIRASMRQRMQRELCNTEKFLEDYEAQLRRVWQEWCRAPA